MKDTVLKMVLQMIQAGKSHREIQDVTGLGLATISRWRNEGKCPPKQKMFDIESAVVINDGHRPYHDDEIDDHICSHIELTRPDYIVNLGDLADFYAISSFNKNPSRISPVNFAKELVCIRQYLGRLRLIAPQARIIFIKGNHEDRLERYLWKNAPVLDFGKIPELKDIEEYEDLPKLTIPDLFGFKKYDIEYHEDGFQLGKLYCTHGSIVRKHSGYTAKAEYDKNGCVGISGHTHRDGKYTLRNRSGQWVWWENFCTCDLDPEYANGQVMNWTQGFSHVTLVNGSPRVEQIPIVDGFYVFGGVVYR